MKVINVDEAKKLLAQNKITILDIRDGNSYQQSHIEDAIHVDLNHLFEMCDTFDKNQPILVYCYHGISSLRVGEALENLNFNEVYSLEGGYASWI